MKNWINFIKLIIAIARAISEWLEKNKEGDEQPYEEVKD